jgi:site-specific recombinase XerD
VAIKSIVGARARSVLSHFFTWAIGEGYAESNPVGHQLGRAEDRTR